MKKLILSAILGVISFTSFSQSGVKYATGLNVLSSADGLGSSNNAPVRILTNNSERIRITETGNVGIGITAPTDKLHVAGTARLLNANVDNLMQALSVTAQNANFATVVISGQLTTSSITSSTGNISFSNNNLSTTGNLSAANITASGTLNAQTILQNGNPINQSQWITNVSDIFFMGGNVGIGTSTPSEKLEVDGRVRISSSSDSLPAPVLPPPPPVISPVPRAPAVYTINHGDSSSIIIDGGVDQITATSGRIDFVTTNLVTLGKIGIGTQTPAFPLEVVGTIKITGPVTNPPSAQQQSILLDGGTDAITATSGTLTFPNTNLVTSGSITSANIITQQLTINGGMLESDTMHARKAFSVNNSLRLSRLDVNNFAEVSTIDTSVALVLQRDTTGRGVGIGTTPSLGERLSVAGDVGIINGNLRVSNLSGIGDRQLLIDGSGNFKSGNPAPLFGCAGPWCINGNQNTNPSTDFLGTTDAQDLIFKTDNQERIRITSTGAHPGNVGIGTSTPEKKLHVVTTHTTCASCPALTHEGIRLEEHTTYTDLPSPPPSVWDLQPYGAGFAIKRPNESPNIVITGVGVGIGTSGPMAKLHVDGSSFFDGNVGIGTSTPATKLEVKGSAALNEAVVSFNQKLTADPRKIFFVPYLGGSGYNFISQPDDAGIFWTDGLASPGHNQNAGLVIGPWDGGTQSGIRITHDGNVGVGTGTPLAKLEIEGGSVGINLSALPSTVDIAQVLTDYQLAVAGKVVAEEYVAKLKAEWPDYVLKDNYQLLDLLELEKIIKEKNHLPKIPSAEEFEKNGVSLGEIAILQMEKIEELTLYIIDMNKKILKLTQRIAKLEKKLLKKNKR